MDTLPQTKASTRPLFLSFIAFIVIWFAGQTLAPWLGTDLSFLFYGVITMGVFGALIPLWLMRRADLPLAPIFTPTKKWLGWIGLIIALVFGLGFSGAVSETWNKAPSISVVVRYILYFAPMALAVTLQCFWIVPKIVSKSTLRPRAALALAVILSAVALGLSFAVDTLFLNAGLVLMMAIMGLFLGLGIIWTKNFWAVYLVFFAIIIFNTLGEAKYYSVPWWIAGVVFGVAVVIWTWFLGTGRTGPAERK